MRAHLRASRAVDVNRAGEALSRPGIDSRVWVSLAIVDGPPLLRAGEGYFCDVILLPSQAHDTARVGADYAGDRWGDHCPLRDGDEVVVIAPSGDPDLGLVVSARLHSPSDRPPAQAESYPDDRAITIRPGQRLRLNVSEGGAVLVNDTHATGAQPRVAREGDPITLSGTATSDPITGLLNGLVIQTSLGSVSLAATGGPVTNGVPFTTGGSITGGSDVMRVGS